MINFLVGKRTYIAAIGLGVVTTLHALGYVTDGTRDVLVGFLGATGLAALRASVTRW